jgi:hypothetical protein
MVRNSSHASTLQKARFAIPLSRDSDNKLVSAGPKASAGRSVRYRSPTVAAQNESMRGSHAYRRPWQRAQRGPRV